MIYQFRAAVKIGNTWCSVFGHQDPQTGDFIYIHNGRIGISRSIDYCVYPKTFTDRDMNAQIVNLNISSINPIRRRKPVVAQ